MPGDQIMSSNLPLLFAKGQPRSLETIVQDELEEFVHFMVLCSLKIEVDNRPDDLNQLPLPQWWPEEVTFKFPICDNGDHNEKQVVLKKLVCRCYTFYDCEYYLKFSSELSEKPSADIKYRQNIKDKTTTILDANGQVLVKCRSVNFCYDKRKTRHTTMLRTPDLSSITVPPLQLTQPKRIAPLIDLTFESSGDETEVCFKEQTSFPVNIIKKTKKPVERTCQISLRTRRLPKEQTSFPANNTKSKAPEERTCQISLRKRLQEETVDTSKDNVTASSSSKSPKKKLLLENFRQEEVKPNVEIKETVDTSKDNVTASSSKSPKKKLLLENFRQEEVKTNVEIKESQPEKTSQKRKRNVQLPVIRKKRLFEDFPKEEIEPTVVNKEEFLSRLELIPHQKETVKLDHKIYGRKKLSKSFSFIMLTSERGQAVLGRNNRFNMAASLDRNSKSCGTHQQEEDHMCTRSNNTSFCFTEDALIPQNASAYARGHIHSYKWPHRGRKVVYPQRGPSVKQCSVELTLLSKETINLWSMKKYSKATMTPEDWQDSNASICACQKIPLIILDDESTSKVKNKSTSTRCKCINSKVHPKSQEKSCENNNVSNLQAFLSFEAAIVARQKSDSLSFKYRTLSSTCADSSQQINLPFLTNKESFSGFPCTQSEAPLSCSKRVYHRRPLAVVPSEPITINEEIVDSSSQCVTSLPDDNSSSSTIKLYNFFRSMADAIKWYTKDEPSDRPKDPLVKEGIMFGTDRSQENIKPFTELSLPGSKRPIDYFKIDVDLSERDYCYERSSGEGSKLVTRRGERHYVNREPCPSCFHGKDNFCVYEFIRQAKLAGITLSKNPKQLKVLFSKFVQGLNIKE